MLTLKRGFHMLISVYNPLSVRWLQKVPSYLPLLSLGLSSFPQ